jgi:small redox-active disulfide protein 2
VRKLQVLGTGCPACRRLAALVAQAATDLGLEFELEKIGDIDRILAFDVASTPALVIDGEVRCAGRVPSMNELRAMLQ